MQQYVGKGFKSRAIMGHGYPILAIDCHEHVMADMMVFEVGICIDFWTIRCELKTQPS